ncbi:MAG: c-type cytochrome [Nitrospina sp.]|jgi:mono/diheme cytochrome c family protein|nr:c-type cytochrome [Nitrospina sp.]MBT6717867.1 c-type cytochrome [Nitrospina sp.]
MPKWVAIFGLTVGLLFHSSLAAEQESELTKTIDPNFVPVKIYTVVSGICPQNRTTKTAPGRYLDKTNPLPPTKENIERGKKLFTEDAKPTACKLCHGHRGNGNGSLARRMEPPPRNFTCGKVMDDLPDGQLFWIIQNGSKGTAMPAHKFSLNKEQIWQLILYIRNFLET